MIYLRAGKQQNINIYLPAYGVSKRTRTLERLF